MKPGARLVLASGNQGKLAELGQLLAPLELEVLPQSQFQISEAAETASTFLENALIKARHASAATGLPALADDSGLVVPALGGLPGIHSARYAGEHGDDAANNRKLLEALDELPEADRKAYFHCSLVLLRHPEDPAPLVAEGSWQGRILLQARGNQGFGYDPLFFDPVLDRAAAELTLQEKGRVSHRGQALARLLERIAATR